MKHKLNDVLGFKMPPDGRTPEEELLEKLLCENTVETLYKKLPTNRMKFIVAGHFELGYTQEMMADILNVRQEWISQEIENIRNIFLGRPSARSKKNKPYKPRTVRRSPGGEGNQISVEKLLELCIQLSHE